MSHLIKIYTVWKFSYFCLWYLKSWRVAKGLNYLHAGSEDSDQTVGM